MKVFQNESEVEQLGHEGGLTFENRTDRISIYGQIDITRDLNGLALAKEMMSMLEDIVGFLSAERRAGMLPSQLEYKPLCEESNPFNG